MDDLTVITKTFPLSQNVLNVYCLGDLHVGSPEYDEASVKKKIDIIKKDKNGVVCIAGDLGDFGLKNSKSNVYLETMSPQEQVNYIKKLFMPIKDKIVAAVSGNHEERITREAGLNVLQELCVHWGCPEVYRENLAITKYLFGSIKGTKQQNCFIGITTHGSSRNKHKKFVGTIENADFGFSAHTHTPEYSPQGRIRIDRIKGTARHVPYKEIVVDAHLKVGGYGLKKEYEVPPPPELQYLELRAVRDNSHNRTYHRIINYHTITL